MISVWNLEIGFIMIIFLQSILIRRNLRRACSLQNHHMGDILPQILRMGDILPQILRTGGILQSLPDLPSLQIQSAVEVQEQPAQQPAQQPAAAATAECVSSEG